jgi:hypothetical protein
MGVAVFVDLDDDVLAELKLGTSADEITALGTDYYGSGSFAAPTTNDPVCVDGTDGHFVGNPEGNLLRLDLGVQFAQPFGTLGPQDPATQSFAQISYGGVMHDELIDRQTFTFKGTARRRVQVLPFNSLSYQQPDIFNGSEQVATTGFNPFGGSTTVQTNIGSAGFIHRGGGVLNATFKQLEV